MKLGDWLQINEKHYVPRNNNIVFSLFEIYFKYFWIALLKDKFGYEFYLNIFGSKLWLAQNKKLRKIQ